jgi:hypothetical protein
MPQPAFLSMFEQPNSRTVNNDSTLKANSASNKTALQVFDEAYSMPKSVSNSANTTQSKKRFAVKSAKSKKMSVVSTVRRLTRKYSKKCRHDNLQQLMNWKNDNWNNKKKGIRGMIYDSGKILETAGVPDDALAEVYDTTFPKVIHDCFTKCLFDLELDTKGDLDGRATLIDGVIKEGNRVQMWKLLTEKGDIWHVSCIIWHNGEPYSFGFDTVGSSPEKVKYAKLACRTPNEYLEIAIFRQRMKNPTLKAKGPKYLELLATNTLDEHMVKELTRILGSKSNSQYSSEGNYIFQGFNPVSDELKAEYSAHKTKLEKDYNAWIEYVKEKSKLLGTKKEHSIKPPEGVNMNATKALPTLMDKWVNEPFQLSVREIMVKFSEFYYCKYDKGRKDKRKNCMGALDSIFQDIFSCRIFGTYIHPKFCGPKTKCIHPDDAEDATENNKPNTVKSTTKKATLAIANSARNTANVRSIVMKRKNGGKKYRMTELGGGKRNTRKLRK